MSTVVTKHPSTAQEDPETQEQQDERLQPEEPAFRHSYALPDPLQYTDECGCQARAAKDYQPNGTARAVVKVYST